MLRWTLRISTLLSLAAAGLCGFFFHQQYWQWRGRFNENGVFLNEWDHRVYQEQSGLAFGSLILVFLAIALIFGTLSLRKNRAK